MDPSGVLELELFYRKNDSENNNVTLTALGNETGSTSTDGPT
jgi:hypothetical protein